MENTYNNDTLRANLLNLLNLKSYDQLNKAKFAESMNLQPDAIKKLTSGATQNPGIKTIVAIANKLGCSIDELVGYSPKQKTVAKIISKDLELNDKLFQSTVNFIFTYIHEKRLKPNVGKILHLLDNIYDYSFRRNLDYPDLDFANWIITAAFKGYEETVTNT
jgi:transcriptional regulator with XRE-family HTH domain